MYSYFLKWFLIIDCQWALVLGHLIYDLDLDGDLFANVSEKYKEVPLEELIHHHHPLTHT